jgi:hypothetical protein
MLFHKKKELKIDVLSNLCGLKLIRMIVYNLNGKIILNIDWEFWLKIDGLDCFKFTYIKLNANKRNCMSFFKFNYIHSFHHLMESVKKKFQNFLLQYLKII